LRRLGARRCGAIGLTTDTLTSQDLRLT
jgi:hypothetical protein